MTERTGNHTESELDPLAEMIQSYVDWVIGIGATMRRWIHTGDRQRIAEEASELAFLAWELNLPHVPSAAMRLQHQAVAGSRFDQNQAMAELTHKVQQVSVVASSSAA